MGFHPIDLLPVALLAVFVYKSKPLTKGKGFDNDYLSITAGRSLRGVFAIVVVFHHLAQKMDAGVLFDIFSKFGFLAVSVFMFLSGFGLQKSHMKSESYRKKFLLRRIPQVLFPYIIVNVLFWLMYALDGKIYSVKDIALTFAKGEPLVSYSWYIVNILIFYVVYWLLMLLFKKRYLLMIIGAVVFYIVYAAFCFKMRFNSYWYSSSHLFILGMVWAVYEDKILGIIKKRYIFISAASLVLFLALFIIKSYHPKMVTGKVLPLTITMTASALFMLLVILYSLRVKFGNRILEFLGNCSLEIYLVQGLFIVGLRGNRVFIENELIWAVMTVIGSIVLGFILHVLFAKLLRGYRRLLKLDK